MYTGYAALTSSTMFRTFDDGTWLFSCLVTQLDTVVFFKHNEPTAHHLAADH